ncbi:hypothetical protein GCM10007938_03190 [Vibrio zhanjiangensis]|uniref:Uncharacterized protein n=1 Tax=Vibrio zhanjiangensis TaxID=1046128 RepID=A0ABQ6ETP9_9VIBR|nr:hypothetical protein [Vibrio zhanjiangensis]GLT16543.1 hypothetical protein GCM10007938_03190 [Vibrio zhanjiangensis]
MSDSDVIASLRQYNNLKEVEVEPGDVIIVKIFPGWAHDKIASSITKAQKYFHWKSPDEKAGMKLQGAATSEHVAIGLSATVLAEAAAEIHGTDEIPTSAAVVYKCTDKELAKAAVTITKALCRLEVDARPKGLPAEGGRYDMLGAAKSLYSKRTFHASTNEYIEDILSFVYGGSNIIPDMFCSQLAVAAYESASVAIYGKTCFGSDPRGVTPRYMEHLLNTRGNFYLAGRIAVPPLLLHTDKVIHNYENARKWRQSADSVELHSLLYSSWCKQAEQRKQGVGELLYLYETYFGLNVKPEYRSEMKPMSNLLLNSYPAVKALQMKPKRSGRLYNMVFKEIAPLDYFM